MKKILFVSSSRADYGLLRDVIIETQKINKETYQQSMMGVNSLR